MVSETLKRAPEILAPVAVVYDQRVKQFGAQAKGVYWSNRSNQLLRFKILTTLFGEDAVNGVEVDGKELFSQSDLPQFYTNRNFELAWKNKKNRKDLIESIQASYDEGLNPADYHLEKIPFD